MPKTTSVKLESIYKEDRLHFVLHTLLALFLAPILIMILIHSAVTNEIDNPILWIILILVSLFSAYLSYLKFQYIYFIYFEGHRADIDSEKKTIVYFPFNKTVSAEQVTAFVYSTKLKSYLFLSKESPAISFEINRNVEFEKALQQLSLKCKEE